MPATYNLLTAPEGRGMILMPGVDIKRFFGGSFKVTADEGIHLPDYFRGPHCWPWDGNVLYSLVTDLPPIELQKRVEGTPRHYAAAPNIRVPHLVLKARERIAREDNAPVAGTVYSPRPLDDYLDCPSTVTLYDFLAVPAKTGDVNAVIQHPYNHLGYTKGLDIRPYTSRTHCWIGNTLYSLGEYRYPVQSNRLVHNPSYWYARSSRTPFEVQEVGFRILNLDEPDGPSYKFCYLYDFLSAPRHVHLHEFQSVLRPIPAHAPRQPRHTPTRMQKQLNGTKESQALVSFAGFLWAIAASQFDTTTSGVPAANDGNIDRPYKAPFWFERASEAKLITADPGVYLIDYFEGRVAWGLRKDHGWEGWVVYPPTTELPPLKMEPNAGTTGQNFSLVDIMEYPVAVQAWRQRVTAKKDRDPNELVYSSDEEWDRPTPSEFADDGYTDDEECE
ncbi:hypothetical protein DFH06DRAFT_1323638 [Mycena polygramma]|nr:hypothetical protein DFH06DRAFT_1323638 [Mycena polygramma]